MEFWKIEGYNSLSKIYEKELKSGCLSEKQIQAVLQSLVAKAALDFDEIVGAYAKRGTRIANDLLQEPRVRHDNWAYRRHRS